MKPKNPPSANFSVKTIKDKQSVINHIEKREGRFTVSITQGIKRSNEQNKTQRKWVREIKPQGDQLGLTVESLGLPNDFNGIGENALIITTENWRAYLKLWYGVPILREENEAFREKYDKFVKPLTYPEKLEMMQEPVGFPVTSLMTTKQKSQFLRNIYFDFTNKGFSLTDPSWQGWQNIK